jgi:hypothetical protein
MQRLRTIKRTVRLLVALFLAAQFSGVVPAPLAGAQPSPIVVALHSVHHAHASNDGGCAHQRGDLSKDHADYCCALHAFFAGILQPAVTVDPGNAVGERLFPRVADLGVGANPPLLDRPPRPLA